MTTFEEYLKNTKEFTAVKARIKAKKKIDDNAIADFQNIVENNASYKNFIESIREAASNGETQIVVYPMPQDEIESKYTKEHKIVPEEALFFSDDQSQAFEVLTKLGYVVSMRKTQFYADGMNMTCDVPLEGELAIVYWGK